MTRFTSMQIILPLCISLLATACADTTAGTTTSVNNTPAASSAAIKQTPSSANQGTFGNLLARDNFIPSAWSTNSTLVFMVTENVSNAPLPETYILTPATPSTSAAIHLIGKNVTSARLSPDGSHVLVLSVNDNTGTVLSLLTADGKQSTKLASAQNGDIPFEWINNDTFYFGKGNQLDEASIGSPPHAVPLPFVAKTDVISALSVSPDQRFLAINVTHDAANLEARFDELFLYNVSTHSFQSLVKASTGNALRIGRWQSDSTGLFFWPDPLFSGSLLQDGSKLTFVDLRGHTRPIADTLVNSAVPCKGGATVVQLGTGRQLYLDKSIAIWNGQRLSPIPHKPGTVQFRPTVSPDGQSIAYIEAPAFRGDPTSNNALTAWMNSERVMVYDRSTGKVRTASSQVGGYTWIGFDASGQRILYVADTGIGVIDLAVNAEKTAVGLHGSKDAIVLDVSHP